jgi:hypothetical protein
MESNIIFGGKSVPAHVTPYFRLNRKIIVRCAATIDCENPSPRHNSINKVSHIYIYTYDKWLFPKIYLFQFSVSIGKSYYSLSYTRDTAVSKIGPKPLFWYSRAHKQKSRSYKRGVSVEGRNE